MTLRVSLCSIGEARMGVARLHRHLRPPLSGLVAFAVAGPSGMPCGWAIVGRPGSRVLQASGWVELTRSATDGTAHACSALLGAAARWARRRGSPIVTYTLEGEPGTSLVAAGWVEVGQTKGGQWDRDGRPRRVRSGVAAGAKRRWVPPWAVDAWTYRQTAAAPPPTTAADPTPASAAQTAQAARERRRHASRASEGSP